MERVRKTFFSGTWYPENGLEVEKQLYRWEQVLAPAVKNSISGIVPHAGWFFSGIMAYDVIRRFPENLDVLFILGGHLPENNPIIFYDYDSFETPLGPLPVEKSIISSIRKKIHCESDESADNTIEVQLPLISHILGQIPIVPLRVPSGQNALKLAEIINTVSSSSNLNIAVLGSTDLTHYGLNYNFIPQQSLEDPLKWVEESDRRILQAMIDVEPVNILELAHDNQSACSAGAAACATSYARIRGITSGTLLQYDTSYSKHKSESFVGYGSVVYAAGLKP